MRISNWLKDLGRSLLRYSPRKTIRKTHHRSPCQAHRTRIEELEIRTLLTASNEIFGPQQFISESAIAGATSEYLPELTYITPNGGLLTGPQAGDPLDLALSYLASHAAELGLFSEDVANPLVTDAYRDLDSGTTYIYLKQQLNGLEVENTTLNTAVSSLGEIITVGSRFVGGLSSLEGLAAYAVNPVLSPVDAIAAITNKLGLPEAGGATVTSGAGGVSQAQVLNSGKWSLDPIPVHLEYVATPSGPRLTWDAVLRTPDGEHWYNASVDAATGDLMLLSDWIDHLDTYNVVAMPDMSPDDGRTVLVNPANPTWSPYGWHDTNGVAGAEFTDTRGNNVYAQEDLDANDVGGTRPNGGSGLQFNYPLDLTQQPGNYLSSSITNLFYMNNFLHDVHAVYGFTEAAGNFQQFNYSGQGTGGDAVQADAQDGSGTDNANFGTPPDGFTPLMQQYVFTSTFPFRDSDLENQIIAHEYGHGVTNRLTGGPANANALDALQSGGMGEGWGDFWATILTQSTTDLKLGSYPLANYVLGLDSTGGGGRTYPYSYDMTIDPHTWNDYNTVTQEYHYAGEIWASTLWDLNWLLIDKYGFDPDLTTGYAAGGGPASAGNKLALKLVMDALKLQPANPSFINGRDAIIAADQALTGGQNQREIWRAFARRGLGSSASTSNSDSFSVTTSFTLPAALNNPGVISVSPAGRTNTPLSSLTFVFSEAMNQTSFGIANDVVSFTGPGGTDLLSQITGFAWVNSTTLRIDFNSQATQGQYSLVVGPDILANDNGSAMNQDGDNTSGEAVQDRFTAYFAYDAAPLTVASTTPAADSNADVTLTTVTVNFSEAFDPASLSPSDLQVSQGTVTGAVATDADTATFTISGITVGPLYLNLKYGAVTDTAGFASEFYSSVFYLQYTTDYGDAPDTYGTLNSNNGAYHVVGGPYLGLQVDREADGQPNGTASGDGADEDGIVLLEPFVAGQTAQIQVITGGTGTKKLDYFFDFDHDGVFGNNANEIFSATLLGGVDVIPVTIPAAVTGSTYARFRLSTSGGLGPTGPAPDGEVEDYVYPIYPTAVGLDYGDAPSPLYSTTLSANGARHAVGGPQLGATRDVDLDGFANATATGDGTDEDGVTFPQIFGIGNTISVKVTSSAGGGILNAFFDWNRNGIWGDNASEMVTATLTGGTELVTVSIPITASTGVTYARFRISSAGGQSATGFAADGEVEDYQILVIDPVITTNYQSFDGATPPGLPAGWTNTATGTTPQNWRTLNGSGSDSAPNYAFVVDQSGPYDSILTSPVISLTPTQAQLTFRNNYDTEFGYDGGVLEISINGQAYQDIIAAGGSFVAGGYNATISPDFNSPIRNRQAWTGYSGGYIDTIVNLPAAALNQNVRIRWRFGADSSVSAVGWAIDSIRFGNNGNFPTDYGDAPDPTYPTTAANNGASHAQGFSGVFLGASVDTETIALANATATGDDILVDDENGVTLPATIRQAQSLNIPITASATGLLSAWIDYNNDGDWNDSGEQIARDFVLTPGANILGIVVPATATVTSRTFARFRFSTNSGQAPDGKAPDGEVEDYSLAVGIGSPSVNLAVDAVTGSESGTTVITVTVTSNTPVVGDQTINLGVSGTGITAGDYLLSNSVVSILNGTTIGTATFTIQDDALVEGNETAILTLSGPTPGISLGTVISQNVLILDDDSVVTVQTVTNGTEGTSNGLFRVFQTSPNALDTIVTYSVSGSALAGIDYTALTGIVTIPSGATSADIDLSILDDLISENQETVTVTLTGFIAHDSDVVLDSNPANLTSTSTILDDDIAAFSVSDVTVLESDGSLQFTLQSSHALDIDILVSVTFGGGAATSPADYDGTTQNFLFTAGQTSKLVTVVINEDNIVESDETFQVSLGTATSVGTHQVDLSDVGTETITDNDAGIVYLARINDGTEAAVPVDGVFRVSQTALSGTDTVVTYVITGSATAGPGADYATLTGSVTIPAGSASADIVIDVNNDLVVEDLEDVGIQLTGFTAHDVEITLSSNPASLAATLTITDNDSATVSIAKIVDGVDNLVATNGKFRISQSAPSSTDTVVQYSVSGSATANSDYTTLSGAATILAGQTSVDIDVAVISDAIIEGDESVIVTLTGLGAHDPEISLDSNPANLTATVNIVEGQTSPLTISSPTVVEGNSGVVSLTFNVTSPVAVQAGFSVVFAVNNISTDGADYTVITSGPLVFTGVANETHAITVNVIGDTIVEGNETLTVTLGTVTPAGAVAAASIPTGATGTGTINNDDGNILGISSPTIIEGNGGTQILSIDVTSPNAVQGGFTLDFLVTDVSAGSSDYTVLSTSPLSFAGGVGEVQTIAIQINGDITVEQDETFIVTLGGVASVTPGAAANIVSGISGTGTIVNDDQAVFSINDQTVDEAAGTVQLTITSDRPVDVDVIIDVTFSGVTASGGGIDFVSTAQQVTFNAGQTSRTLTVPIINNNIAEATETFTAALSTTTAVGTRVLDLSDDSTVSILDNDAARLTINDLSVNESAGILTFTVVSTNPLDLDLPIEVSFMGQNATAGADYDGASQVVSLLAGQTTVQISVPIINDTINEVAETFVTTLGTNANLGDRDVDLTDTAVGTILDNDNANVTINSVSGSENGPIILTLATDAAFDIDVTFDVTLAGGAATGGGIDFTSGVQQITLLAGETSAVVTVVVNDDGIVEGAEDFTANVSAVTLLSGRAVDLSDTGGGTILDNDVATVSISKISDGIEAVTPTHGKFRVTQSAISSTNTIVQYSVTGLATGGAGQDYATLSGSVTIPAGQNSADIDVTVFDDAIVEGTETVIVTLTGFTSHDPDVTLDATPANVTATVAISESDTSVLSISSPSVTEGNSGSTTMTFTVMSSNAVQGGFSLSFNVSDVTSSAGDYGVVTTSPLQFIGTVNEVKTITVTVKGDLIVEGNEQLTVTLGAVAPQFPVPPASILSGAVGMGTIVNDDVSILTISNQTIVEGDSGSQTMTFNVTSPRAVEGGFALNFNVSDLSANSADYTVMTASPLVFSGNANESQTVIVTIAGDVLVERTELFRVMLGAVQTNGIVLASDITSGASAFGTITDNDTAVFTIDSIAANEAAGTMTFNLATGKALDTDIAITIAFTDQTATEGLDYVGAIQQVTFLPGETSKTVIVPVRSDTLVEAAENFVAKLSTNTVLAGRSVDLSDTGTGTITDDDVAIFTIDNATVDEDSMTISFNLVTDKAIDIDLVVAVSFSNGTATGGGVDFTSNTLLLSFPAGLTTRPATLLISEDNIVEANETFTASLSTTTAIGTRNIVLSDTGTGTIIDNDSATISVMKVSDVNEALAPISGQFRVFQSTVSSTDTVVNYTVTGTAIPGQGNDYGALSGSVTIPAGQTSAAIDVSVFNDVLVESNETIVLTLSGLGTHASAISLSPNPSSLTDTLVLIDDDPLLLTNVNSVSIPENTSTSTVVVDADSDPLKTPGHTLAYSLSGPDAALFNINSVTGEVTFRSVPDFELPIDQGANNTYLLTVTVTADVDPVRSTSQNLVVTVTAVNDNAPVFADASPSFTIAENLDSGAFVGVVFATDSDRPQQSIAYSIVGGNTQETFGIDPVTGRITVNDSTLLDYETLTGPFTLAVRASDSGHPSNTSDAVVVIHVANVFEGPTIAIPDDPGIFQPGTPPAPVTLASQFTYGDVANPSFNGSTLIASIGAGRMSKDVLSILKTGDPTGQITVKRHSVFANGQLIGTFSGGRGRHPNLFVKLNENVTTPILEALINRIGFSSKSTTLTTRTIQLQIVNVQGVSSNIATRQISVD